MDNEHQVYTYSWHQSHDQATVLLIVPYETLPEDVMVVIEGSFLVAGIRGQPPIIKGKLYGAVDMNTSMWQLEPRTSGSARGRTASTASTRSTQSSYAYVSDAEISSSFAASLAENAHDAAGSDSEAPSSPAVSHPASRDELVGVGGGGGGNGNHSASVPAFPSHNHREWGGSHPTSPQIPTSMTSSFSSIDSFQPGRAGRLLTLYLEKTDSAIWPALVVGPVPDAFSQAVPGPYAALDPEAEQRYNMDPTSLGLVAEECLDIRNDREEAFENYVRSWYQAHTPLSTLRLVTHFLPTSLTVPQTTSERPARGTSEYYIYCVGGPTGLARLYLDAGLLHLEGTATVLMSSTYSALSSIRTAEPRTVPSSETGTRAWRRDRESARRYFDRARQLCPQMDIPYLPLNDDDVNRNHARTGAGQGPGPGELLMPTIDVEQGETLRPDPQSHAGAGTEAQENTDPSSTLRMRRRRRPEAASASATNSILDDEEDNTWYLYLPGIIGAGTALLVVGVVSALSFSSWRKSQN